MNDSGNYTRRIVHQISIARIFFLLIVLFFNSAYSLRVRIAEIYSGNTFKTSDGTIVRAIAWDSGNAYELLCDEPFATSIAKRILLGQTVLMWQRGIDPSGTELISIQVNGIAYEEILTEEGACQRDDSPLAFIIPEAPILVPRNRAIETDTTALIDTIVNPSARYAANTNGILPEVYWQHAFNELIANGATEVVVEAGRADIVNGTYAIEVDRIHKWHEAIGQAIHYAEETGKQPAIALFDDGSPGSAEAYAEAQKICNASGIKVWKINDYVSTGYRIRNSGGPVPASVPASWLRSSTVPTSPDLQVGPRNGIYYINSSGNKEYVTDRYSK